MVAIARRSLVSVIGTPVTLASANDLDGTTDGTQVFEVSGGMRGIVLQVNDGTAGTAGIDVIEYSHDNVEWAAAADVLPVGQNDTTGTIQAAGALNAAGVEPTLYAAFKVGPWEGPTYIRCGRKTTTTTGTTWVTGAPSVLFIPVGIPAGGGALTAEA